MGRAKDGIGYKGAYREVPVGQVEGPTLFNWPACRTHEIYESLFFLLLFEFLAISFSSSSSWSPSHPLSFSRSLSLSFSACLSPYSSLLAFSATSIPVSLASSGLRVRWAVTYHARHAFISSLGTFHPLLTRLQLRGCLRYQWQA